MNKAIANKCNFIFLLIFGSIVKISNSGQVLRDFGTKTSCYLVNSRIPSILQTKPQTTNQLQTINDSPTVYLCCQTSW